MLFPDVNVLIYAFRSGAPNHTAFRDWLEKTITGESAFGLSDLVLRACPESVSPGGEHATSD
jgi:uncharacterized protein